MLSINKITQYYFLLLLFSPLLSYHTLRSFNISSQYYMGVMISLIGIMYLTLSQKKIKIPEYAWWLFLYIIYTLVWSFNTGEIEERGYRVFSKNQLIHVFFALIVIENFNFTDRFVYRIRPILKYTVIAAAAVSIIQLFYFSFMDANPIWTRGEIGETLFGDLYKDRRSSIFGFVDPNELGLSYLPLLSVLIGLLMYNRNKYYYIFLLLGGISAFLSNTRYVMVAFVLLSLQIFIVQKESIQGILRYLLITFFLGFFLIQFLNFIGYNLDDWVSDRLFPEGSLQETTRYKAFITFGIFFPEHPWLGIGSMTDELKEASAQIAQSSQIHVGYLSHLVYYGIFGSFLAFGFWFKLARHLLKTAKLTNYWGSFFAFLIFLWANATLVTFHIFFYGIIIALAVDKYFRDKIAMQKRLKMTVSNLS